MSVKYILSLPVLPELPELPELPVLFEDCVNISILSGATIALFGPYNLIGCPNLFKYALNKLILKNVSTLFFIVELFGNPELLNLTNDAMNGSESKDTRFARVVVPTFSVFPLIPCPTPCSVACCIRILLSLSLSLSLSWSNELPSESNSPAPCMFPPFIPAIGLFIICWGGWGGWGGRGGRGA